MGYFRCFIKKKLGMNLDFISILLGLAFSHGLGIFEQFKPEYNYKKRDLFNPDRENRWKIRGNEVFRVKIFLGNLQFHGRFFL